MQPFGLSILSTEQKFLSRIAAFSISIAIQQNGRLEHGLVYDPIRSELFYGHTRAWGFLNERRLRVSKIVKLEEALIGTGFPHYPAIVFLVTCKALSASRKKFLAFVEQVSAALIWPTLPQEDSRDIGNRFKNFGISLQA